jgi:hypothetical protein
MSSVIRHLHGVEDGADPGVPGVLFGGGDHPSAEAVVGSE